MIEVTDEELLRLAQKAFPGESFEVWKDGHVHWSNKPWSSPVHCFPPRNHKLELCVALARKAQHAALQVLAGELDVDAMNAQLAKRREPTDAAVERYCEQRHGLAWEKYSQPSQTDRWGGWAAECRANARTVLRELLALCDGGDGAT